MKDQWLVDKFFVLKMDLFRQVKVVKHFSAYFFQKEIKELVLFPLENYLLCLPC